MKRVEAVLFHFFFGGISLIAGGVAGGFLGMYVRGSYWRWYPEESFYASDNFLVLTTCIGTFFGLVAYVKFIRDVDRCYWKKKQQQRESEN